ncbi:helix-turn-helix domain-containing protein [Nocardia gipuzkoensis]
MRGAVSAPTARVVDIIELLSRPGSERLRYSDIARELDLTQATTHAILKTLCDRGRVSRDPAVKTFALGPGLAPVAAAVNTRPFDRGRPGGLGRTRRRVRLCRLGYRETHRRLLGDHGVRRWRATVAGRTRADDNGPPHGFGRYSRGVS